jgi:hypothetical protein
MILSSVIGAISPFFCSSISLVSAKGSEPWPACERMWTFRLGADRLDVAAQPAGKGLHGASVKTRTFARTSHFVGYNDDGKFDWLAIVVLPAKAASDAASSLFRKTFAQKRSYWAGPRKGRGADAVYAPESSTALSLVA